MDGTFRQGMTAECAIVFGAAVHAVDDPGPGILRRVNAGVRLYDDQRVERLIFTGGKGTQTQQSEAEVMRDVARELDIPDAAMSLETRSTSTWENIEFSMPLLEACSSVVGVSDRYHLARIALIARRQGIRLATYPAQPPSSAIIEWGRIIRETAGYVVYWVGLNPDLSAESHIEL